MKPDKKIEKLKRKYVDYRLYIEKSAGVQTNASPYIKSYQEDFERDKGFITGLLNTEVQKAVEDGVRGFANFLEASGWEGMENRALWYLSQILKEEQDGKDNNS